ncbi:MAG: hypothetical protein ACK5QC_03355 [Bacteroidota bacterium]
MKKTDGIWKWKNLGGSGLQNRREQLRNGGVGSLAIRSQPYEKKNSN